jgi:hypothetical protein
MVAKISQFQKCECTTSISGCVQAKVALIMDCWPIPKEDKQTTLSELLLTNKKYVLCIWKEGKCIHGKPEAKSPLGKPWRRWKENIKIYLIKSKICCVNCIDLGQYRGKEPRLLKTIVNLRAPENERNIFPS